MELALRPLVALAAAAAVAVIAVSTAVAAKPRKLSANVDHVKFTTSYEATKDGGKFSWKLDAGKLGKGKVMVRLIVLYRGKPLALTLCLACRPSETGQAIVLTELAKSIAAGKATFEVTPARGKRLTAPLRP